MKKFIIQFKKAQERKMFLMYDGMNNRYLVTKNRAWLKWPKSNLIISFV